MKKFIVYLKDAEVQQVELEADSETQARELVEAGLYEGNLFDNPDKFKVECISESCWEVDEIEELKN